MSEVQPAASADPGRWLLRPDVHWQDLVRYGPPGFAVYLRIPFEHDPQAADQAGELLSLRRVLETLASHTATPNAAYAAIWEGWTGGDPAPDAPRIPVPNRTMLLFTGPVVALRDAPALAWEIAEPTYAEPHLVWPEDRAWCLACDIDEEIEFTVGCSDDAAQALVDALPVAVRRVQYGDPAPLNRDPE
jgi:hypothetical protein